MHVCAACARRGPTCCQVTDILLTRDDIGRIARQTGLAEFWEMRVPRDPTCLGDEGDPNWLRYTLSAGGRRRVLRQTPAGDCLFLGPEGCRLPADVRPLICRLHPFTYTELALTGTAGDCPRVPKPASSPQVWVASSPRIAL